MSDIKLFRLEGNCVIELEGRSGEGDLGGRFYQGRSRYWAFRHR